MVIDPEVGVGIIQQIKARQGALKLSERAFRVAQGLDDVEKLAEDYKKWFDNDSVVTEKLTLDEVSTDLELLLEKNYAEQGLRWRLDCLNKSLGSLRRGNFGFIFARPETGKTTFLASEATRFVEQLKPEQGPVVWLNNEQAGWEVMLRVYQAFFGIGSDQLLSNPRRYKQEFIERTNGKFKLFDSATISRTDVERLVSVLKPSLVIYDQIDKIKGFASDRDDLMLGDIYQWARELAKNNHAAIGVCQASGTAEGVRYLTMDHVANAKTSKQAEADFIIGIGRSHAEDAEYIRYLNITKNKLLGDADSIADLRHGKFETLIKPEIARYLDIVNYG